MTWDLPPKGRGWWGEGDRGWERERLRLLGMSWSIIFCIPTVKGRMCVPSSIAKEGGAGLNGQSPSTCDLEMFPPECLRLCPLPGIFFSAYLWGREARLLADIAVVEDISFAKAACLTISDDWGSVAKGTLVVRLGAIRECLRCSLVVWIVVGWAWTLPVRAAVRCRVLGWVFWLSDPESHFSRRRAENLLTRGGRFWNEEGRGGKGERGREGEGGREWERRNVVFMSNTLRHE